MALFNVVKCDAVRDEYVWKFPTEDLKLGSQLIVRPGQTAFFCKGGKIFDEFTEGTYTIKSENLPLLNKLINLPFGGKSPFQAEVWFINTLTSLDARWGTPTPILLEDPGYGIVVPVRAFGQYGIKIGNPRDFFEKLIGTLHSFSKYDIETYFTGIIVTRLSDYISKQLVFNNIPILKISAYLQELSEAVTVHLKDQFATYGIELVNFFIMSINLPEDDENVAKLKKVTGSRMHINTLGKDVYAFDRTMDVMEKAADNPGMTGGLMGAGLGMGAGLAMGPTLGQQFNQMGQQMNQGTNAPAQASPPPPPGSTSQYYLFQNDQQYGPYPLDTIKSYVAQKTVTPDSIMWKNGMGSWEKASLIPEISAMFNQGTPPPPPMKKE